jgi:hypothetical protein
VIANLTPHAMHLYPPGTADRIDPSRVPTSQITTIPSSTEHAPVRIRHAVAGLGLPRDGIPSKTSLSAPTPPKIDCLSEPNPNRHLISLIVGLAAPHRDNVLVLHDNIRDLDGIIIGSRKPARRVQAATAPSTSKRRTLTLAS